MRVPEAVRYSLDNLSKQILGDAKVFAAIWVEKGISLVKELGNIRAARGVSLQTAAERCLEAWRNADFANAEVGIGDFVVAVYNGEDSGHLVCDVGKRGSAVDHLVEDTAETPDIRGLAESHVFGAVAIAEEAAGAACRVFKRFGRHVIWCADVGVAMHVYCVVDFNGICNAKVDEL